MKPVGFQKQEKTAYATSLGYAKWFDFPVFSLQKQLLLELAAIESKLLWDLSSDGKINKLGVSKKLGVDKNTGCVIDSMTELKVMPLIKEKQWRRRLDSEPERKREQEKKKGQERPWRMGWTADRGR